MSYNTGVINNAAPAATLMSTVQSFIDAHAAWVFVETVVGSTATNVTDVYKCLGSVNSFGTDFYVGFCRSGATAGTAKCGFIIGETYDSTAKTFGKGAVYCSNATALTVAADFSYGTARHVANENSLVALTDGFLRGVALNTNAAAAGTLPGTASTNFTYHLSVTNDRIVLVTYSSTATVVFSAYAGLYDSFHSVAVDPFPLIAIPAVGSTGSGTADMRLDATNTGGAFTRDAGVAGSITGAFRAWLSGHGWTWVRGSQGQWGTVGVSKETMSGKWWPSRAVVYPESRAGAVKGLLKPDLLLLDMGEATEALGDLLTIDGTQFVCIGFSTTSGSGMNEVDGGSGGVVLRKPSIWVSQAA